MPENDTELNSHELLDLLRQLIDFADKSCLGDAGESAYFYIERKDTTWMVRGHSCYDGSGSYRGSSLEEGIKTVLREIAEEPEKEKAREFESAYRSFARWKSVSWDEAKKILEGLQ